MNDRKPGMLAPALIGGAVAGVLSGLPFLNCLCCCWVIGGAALASFLLAKDSPVSLTPGDGAIVGALSGISAAVVDSLIGLPLRGLNMAVVRRMMERMSEFSDQVPSGWESWLNRSSGGLTAGHVFHGAILFGGGLRRSGHARRYPRRLPFRKKEPAPAGGRAPIPSRIRNSTCTLRPK
jgi:hypothetical protein